MLNYVGYCTLAASESKGLSDNIIFVMMLAMISIINYGTFSMKQKVALLYSYSYALICWELFTAQSPGVSGKIVLILLLTFIELFIILELLTEDTAKLNFYGFFCKMADFTFQSLHIFKMYAAALSYVTVICAFMSENIYVKRSLIVASIVLMLVAINSMFMAHMELKNVTDIVKEVLDVYPYHKFAEDYYHNQVEFKKRIFLLVYMKDNGFLVRKSPSRHSHEYKKYVSNCEKKEIPIHGSHAIEEELVTYLYYKNKVTHQKSENLISWGKNVEKGIFQFIYAHIFVSSLKKYLQKTTAYSLLEYKTYLAYLYLNTVETWYKGKRNVKLNSFFIENKEVLEVNKWDLNTLFNAIIGLRGTEADETSIKQYAEVGKILDAPRNPDSCGGTKTYKLSIRFDDSIEKESPNEKNDSKSIDQNYLYLAFDNYYIKYCLELIKNNALLYPMPTLGKIGKRKLEKEIELFIKAHDRDLNKDFSQPITYIKGKIPKEDWDKREEKTLRKRKKTREIPSATTASEASGSIQDNINSITKSKEKTQNRAISKSNKKRLLLIFDALDNTQTSHPQK